MNLEMKVLIIDDMNTMVRVLTKLLKQIGFKDITPCVGGPVALKKLEESSQGGDKFDLIFCDWNMPDVNGIDVLIKVRNSDEIKNAIFIMITAESEEEYDEKAIDLKVNGFISKPITKEAIEGKLKEILD